MEYPLIAQIIFSVTVIASILGWINRGNLFLSMRKKDRYRDAVGSARNQNELINKK